MGLSFHPSDGLLAVACRDGYVRVLRVDSLETAAEFKVGAGHVHSAVYDPLGRWLVCGLRTGAIVDALSGRRPVGLGGHRAKVEGLAYTPDGERLRSCSADGTVRVWDVR